MQAQIFRCFIASPNDTKEEREVCDKIFLEINKGIGSTFGFRVESWKWERDSRPSFGSDAQAVINEQRGNDYNIFVGIMWKRFGDPTPRAESGTEEEFEDAYSRLVKKETVEIMFYFNNTSIDIDEIDVEQIGKVQQFKKKVSKLGGLYSPFNGVDDFEEKLRTHLTNYFLNIYKPQDDLTTPNGGLIISDKIRPEITMSHLFYLNDMEATFAHNNADKIFLEDMYVAPDIQRLEKSNKSNLKKTTNLSEITNAVDIAGVKYVFMGNELAGKTASCKFLFHNYFNLGLTPVLINGEDIHSNIKLDAIENIIEHKISLQYSKSFACEEIGYDKVLLIIDDFNKAAKGKNKYWHILIKNLETKFSNIILTGSSLMAIDDSYTEPFANFEMFHILEFGPVLRQEIVHKWKTLNLEEKFIDKNDLLRKEDEALNHIKTAIGKNYFPVYPFYILSMLQAMEAGSVVNQNYSIHGFYYENLINRCFSKFIKNTRDINLFYNYLTYFCYYLFDKGVKEISIHEFREFHKLYCEKVDITYSVEKIMQSFDEAHLLHINQRVRVKEKYVYYFFVAKYLADNINNGTEAKNIISKMSLRIFRDDYANIILFVTHLSKDKFIIEELINNANNIFKDIEPANLEDEIEGINRLVESIPQQVLEQVDIDKSRKAELLEEEESERQENEFENDISSYNNFGLEDDISAIDFLAWLTMAFKTVDILGQIAKKHWGEMDGELKIKLVNSTYNLGLRFLGFYLQLLQSNSDEIVEYLRKIIAGKHFKDKYSMKKSVEEETKDFIFRLCFMATFGTTKRISNAVSDEKLKITFAKVLEDNPHNSFRLIDMGIKLIYSGLPVDEIKKLKEDVAKNNLCLLVLHNLVIDYQHLFEVSHEERSQLNAIFGTKIKEQIAISETSKVMKE